MAMITSVNIGYVFFVGLYFSEMSRDLRIGCYCLQCVSLCVLSCVVLFLILGSIISNGRFGSESLS